MSISPRRPLDLVVASTRKTRSAMHLKRMGACVTEIQGQLVVPTLKHGRLVADAVVIVAESEHCLLGGDIGKAVGLARDIHSLADDVLMRNGMRWNGVPIAIVVDDEATAGAIWADTSLRFVIPCSLRKFEIGNDYYQYVDPWLEIYRRVDVAALANGMECLEDMQRTGHRFEFFEGRWIRQTPPSLRRRHGRHPELEARLYSGAGDALLLRQRDRRSWWNARDVVLVERRAVEADLDRYEQLIGRPHEEIEVQRFFEQRTYMLGSGPFETTAHPKFVPVGAKVPRPPDFVSHSFNAAMAPKPARVIELKRGSARLLTKTGSDVHWSRTVSAALAQARRYAVHAGDRKYKRQMEALFREAPRRTEKLLIAGMASRYDSDKLNLARSYDRDVEVRGHDEQLELAVGRYASDKGALDAARSS